MLYILRYIYVLQMRHVSLNCILPPSRRQRR